MKHFWRIVTLIVLFLSIFAYGFYCWFCNACVTCPSKNPKKLTVVCTIGMITDAVKNIAGDRVTLIGLMGPGVDPHVYHARQRDVYALCDADVIFYNGLHLEGKMTELFEGMKLSGKAIAVSDVLAREHLISTEFKNVFDPHIWHDVSLWNEVVHYIALSLIKHDPENSHYYQERADAYEATLRTLHDYVYKKTQEIDNDKRILVTAHDAFGYFGRAYDFKVVSLQGISTDAQVSTRDIQNLVSFIADEHISVMFVESLIPIKHSQAVQQAVHSYGWNVELGPELYSDALGDSLLGANTYVGMMKYNIDAIVSAIKETQPH